MIWVRMVAVVLAVGVGVSCSAPNPSEEIRALVESGRPDEAIARARAELDEDPDRAELQILYARLLMLRGEFFLAEWPLRRAARDPEYEIVAHKLLAQALLSFGNAAGAVDAIDRVLDLEPDDFEALEFRSRAHVAAVELDRALEDADALLDREPEHARAQVTRLHALLLLERAEEAEAALERVVATVSENPAIDVETRARICALESRFSLEKGDPEGAYARISECVELYPADPRVVDEAVSTYLSRGEHGRVREVLERAVDVAPNDSQLRAGLAAHMRASGELDAAEAVLREGIGRHDPERIVDWRNLYEHFWQLRDYPNAIQALERSLALRLSPQPVELLMLADAYIEVDDYAAAEQVAAKLTDGYRELVTGRVRLEQGDPAGAREALLVGIRTWPNNATARIWLGEAAARLGDIEEALEHYTEAFRIEYGHTAPPEKSDSALRVARIQAAAGTYDGALDFTNRHPGITSARRRCARALRPAGGRAGQPGVGGRWSGAPFADPRTARPRDRPAGADHRATGGRRAGARAARGVADRFHARTEREGPRCATSAAGSARTTRRGGGHGRQGNRTQARPAGPVGVGGGARFSRRTRETRRGRRSSAPSRLLRRASKR